jgi:hypothetical protein
MRDMNAVPGFKMSQALATRLGPEVGCLVTVPFAAHSLAAVYSASTCGATRDEAAACLHLCATFHCVSGSEHCWAQSPYCQSGCDCLCLAGSAQRAVWHAGVRCRRSVCGSKSQQSTFASLHHARAHAKPAATCDASVDLGCTAHPAHWAPCAAQLLVRQLLYPVYFDFSVCCSCAHAWSL